MYCLPTKYGNLILLLYQVLCVSVFPLHQHAYAYCSLLWCKKSIVFTNKLSEYWCHMIKPYLFTKFHASKHSGKRVTQTRMPYFNVWAEVVYCGFPKSKVFTKTLICAYSLCATKLYIYQVSCVGVLWLVRFANSTRRDEQFRKWLLSIGHLFPCPNGPIF